MRHTIIAAIVLASASSFAFAQSGSTAPTTGAASGPNKSEAQPGTGKSKARAQGKTSKPGRTNEASRSPDVRGANAGGKGSAATKAAMGATTPKQN